jgi:uncharacterized protein (DUF433 family)
MDAGNPSIALDPNVLTGKPIIRGTRLSVEFVIGLLAEGWSETDILSGYPQVTGEDVRACLAFVGRSASSGC